MKTPKFPRQTFFSFKRHAKQIVWQSTQTVYFQGDFGSALNLYFAGKDSKETARKFFDELMTLAEWQGGQKE